MALDIMSLFKIIIIVQLFYAASITTLTYTMPENSLAYVTGFSDIADKIDLNTVSADVQDSIVSQTNLPVVELGALVFYSGNILIDLLLNFAFAIPEMISMLVNGIMMLFGIDNAVFAIVQLFLSVLITVMYFVGIIQLLTGIRSGRLI